MASFVLGFSSYGRHSSNKVLQCEAVGANCGFETREQWVFMVFLAPEVPLISHGRNLLKLWWVSSLEGLEYAAQARCCLVTIPLQPTTLPYGGAGLGMPVYTPSKLSLLDERP
jgi:hypothetical protein